MLSSETTADFSNSSNSKLLSILRERTYREEDRILYPPPSLPWYFFFNSGASFSSVLLPSRKPEASWSDSFCLTPTFTEQGKKMSSTFAFSA